MPVRGWQRGTLAPERSAGLSSATHSLLLCTRSIQALLSAPNPDDPLAENVARHWKDNEAEAVATGECRVPSVMQNLHAALTAGASGGACAVTLCVGARKFDS